MSASKKNYQTKRIKTWYVFLFTFGFNKTVKARYIAHPAQRAEKMLEKADCRSLMVPHCLKPRKTRANPSPQTRLRKLTWQFDLGPLELI